MNEQMVEHQMEYNRFLLSQDGHDCVLEYQISDDRINFSSTYVPPELRNHGLAEKLVRAGLKWARDNGYQITATCWYVQKFLH